MDGMISSSISGTIRICRKLLKLLRKINSRSSFESLKIKIGGG